MAQPNAAEAGVAGVALCANAFAFDAWRALGEAASG